MPSPIRDHYEQQLDSTLILQQLREHYPQGPSAFQLAPVDQLHIGGIKASQQLLSRLQALNVTKVLDIGAGLGGLMRLAQESGKIELVGLDLSHEFNYLNQQLSALCPTQPTPALVTADAHHLPFADSSFDLILFQHSLLNIPDDAAVLAECHRLLQPQGYLLMHEVLQGENPEQMVYPVPWARNAESSHLITPQQLHNLLSESGFELQQHNNWSQQALEWRKRQSSKEQGSKEQSNKEQNTKEPASPSQTPPVSPAMILGPEFQQMGGNIIRNLQSGAAQVVEVLARRV